MYLEHLQVNKDEIIDLKYITPDFNEDFDINSVLLKVDNVISNTEKKSVLENFSETKLLLWLLRHYISKQNAQETDKEQPFKWLITKPT